MKFAERLHISFTRIVRRLSEKQLLFILALITGIAEGIMGHLLKTSIHAVQELVTNGGNVAKGNFI